MRINGKSPLIERFNRFIYTPTYFMVLGVLTLLANVFCQELIAYTCIIFMGMAVCLLGRDLLPLLPIFFCGYISTSAGNNPGQNESSVFSIKGGGLYLAVLLTLLAACLLYRLITDPVFGGRKFLTKKRELLSGMLILGVCYGVSGVASGQWSEYGWRNLLFAFLQLVAIGGLYYLFSGGVRWELAPKAYLFWAGITVGYLLLAELLNIYIVNKVIVDGTIIRDRIFTGWGHYNSIGALLAIVMPLPFFLTGKGRYAWFAYFSGFLFCIGLLFTCSRGSILVGVGIYVISYILSLVHTGHARSLKGMHAFVIGFPVIMLVFFHDELLRLFKVLPDLGFDSNLRIETYIEGLKQFIKFPIFGGSFFPVDFWPYAWATTPGFTALFPPRWHNTLVQLLATGGLVCLTGYVIHRIQVVRLFVRGFSGEKLFVGLSVGALLLTSLIDCHFFNVGPVLVYSAALAVVEYQLDNHIKKD